MRSMAWYAAVAASLNEAPRAVTQSTRPPEVTVASLVIAVPAWKTLTPWGSLPRPAMGKPVGLEEG